MELKNLTPKQRADTKATEIVRLVEKKEYARPEYKIEITDTNKIDGGVEVFVRAWKNGKQIGFGKKGDVDIERFRIFNPPVLVDDPTGNITEEYTDEEGVKHTRKLREDAEEATLQVIEHNISVMKNVHDDKRIVKGKIGRTTSTFFPLDNGRLAGDLGSGSGVSWSTLRNAAGNTVIKNASSNSGVLFIRADTGTNNWRNNIRSMYSFVVTGIGSDDIISASLMLHGNGSKSGTLDISPVLNVYEANPNDPSDIVAADYGIANFETTPFTDSPISYASWDENDYNSFALNTAGRAFVADGTITFGVRDQTYDVSGTNPNWQSGSGLNRAIGIHFMAQSGTSEDPKLVVEHEASEIFKIFTIKWSISEYLYKITTIKWSIGGFLKKVVTVKWNIRDFLTKTFTIKWSILDYLKKVFTLKWKIGDIIWKTEDKNLVDWKNEDKS